MLPMCWATWPSTPPNSILRFCMAIKIKIYIEPVGDVSDLHVSSHNASGKTLMSFLSCRTSRCIPSVQAKQVTCKSWNSPIQDAQVRQYSNTGRSSTPSHSYLTGFIRFISGSLACIMLTARGSTFLPWTTLFSCFNLFKSLFLVALTCNVFSQ